MGIRTLTLVLFATFYTQICGDSRPLYQLTTVPVPNPIQHQGEGYFDSFLNTAVAAAPRIGTALWSPFESFSMDKIVQPMIQAFTLFFGLLSSVRLVEWFDGVTGKTKKPVTVTEDKTKVEESNEIGEARRKRTLSVEESHKVLAAIEQGQAKFGL